MATIAGVQTPTAPTSTPTAGVSITSSIKTFARVVYITGTNENAEGDKNIYGVKVVNDDTATELEKTADAEGKMYFDASPKEKHCLVAQLDKQSFTQYSAKTDAGWAELISDEGERAAMLSRGAGTKQDNKARQWLAATDDSGNFVNQVTADSYDQRESLQEITNRRLSPEEKLENELSTVQLTPDMLARFEQLLAMRKASMAAGLQSGQ